MLKFNKLNENCFFIELDKITILISYESIIGLIYKDILYISEYYLDYSKTTKKHIRNFENNLNFLDKKIISNNDLYLFFENIEISNLKEILK